MRRVRSKQNEGHTQHDVDRRCEESANAALMMSKELECKTLVVDLCGKGFLTTGLESGDSIDGLYASHERDPPAGIMNSEEKKRCRVHAEAKGSP